MYRTCVSWTYVFNSLGYIARHENYVLFCGFCSTCLCNSLMVCIAAFHSFSLLLGFHSMTTSQFIPSLMDGQFGAMRNNAALNILYVPFAVHKPSLLLGMCTGVGLPCHFSSSSAAPRCAGTLVHVGAGHSLGFLQTCSRNSSLPRASIYEWLFFLFLLKQQGPVLSFLMYFFFCSLA